MFDSLDASRLRSYDGFCRSAIARGLLNVPQRKSLLQSCERLLHLTAKHRSLVEMNQNGRLFRLIHYVSIFCL